MFAGMKRALLFIVPVVLLVGLFAWAGPRPYAALTVSGAGVTPVCLAAEGATLVVQCPAAAVWYRTVNAAELADAGGLVTTGQGMTDGGAFGVLADFRNQGDPVVIGGANQAGVCLLGIDAGGTYPCYFSAP